MRPLLREEYPLNSFTVFKSPIVSSSRANFFRISRGEVSTQARLWVNKVLGYAVEDAVRIGVRPMIVGLSCGTVRGWEMVRQYRLL